MTYEFETNLREIIKKVTECHKLRNNLHILMTNTNINIKGICSDHLEATLYEEINRFKFGKIIFGTVEIFIRKDYKGFAMIEINEVKDNTPYLNSYRQMKLNL